MISNNDGNSKNFAAIAAYRALHRESKFTMLHWNVANVVGVNEALLIEIIQKWCDRNEQNDARHYLSPDGHWWTSLTYEEWAKNYPAIGKPRTFQRLLLSLEKQNCVLSCHRGKDNTKFYRINEEIVGQMLIGGFETPESIAVYAPSKETADQQITWCQNRTTEEWVKNTSCQILTTVVPNPNSDGAKNEQSYTYIKDHKKNNLLDHEYAREIKNDLENELTLEVFEDSTTTPLVGNEIVVQTEKSSPIPTASASARKKRVLSEDTENYFLAAYRAQKPSNFADHRGVPDAAAKKIKSLIEKFGDTAIEVFCAALAFCREQDDDWWRNKPLTLSNLCSNDKIEDLAQKHQILMKGSKVYKDRIEGVVNSKDLERSPVFDNSGNLISDPTQANIMKGLSMTVEDFWKS